MPSLPCAGDDWRSASDRIERCGSIRLENSVAVASRSGGISGKTAATCSLQTMASVAKSQTKAAWPSEARIAEAGGRTGVTRAPIPKFARYCGELQCELRNQRSSSKLITSARFGTGLQL